MPQEDCAVIGSTMPPLPPDIADIVEAEKTLGITPEWDGKSNPRFLQILAPLTKDLLTIGGFELRLKISKQFVARDALAQLEFCFSGRRSAVPLWRIDWRPFHFHGNDGVPPDCPYETFDAESHEHGFSDNYLTPRAAHEGREPPCREAGGTAPRNPIGFPCLVRREV